MDLVAERLTQEAFCPLRRHHRGPGAARTEVLLIRPRQCARRRAASLSMVMRAARCWTLARRRLSARALTSRALIPGPAQSSTYAMITWHHGFTVLDRPGGFAMFMWLDDSSSGDEEFVPV